jgi:hypothetical protein
LSLIYHSILLNLFHKIYTQIADESDVPPFIVKPAFAIAALHTFLDNITSTIDMLHFEKGKSPPPFFSSKASSIFIYMYITSIFRRRRRQQQKRRKRQ